MIIVKHKKHLFINEYIEEEFKEEFPTNRAPSVSSPLKMKRFSTTESRDEIKAKKIKKFGSFFSCLTGRQ